MDSEAALETLATFLNNARRMGYQVESRQVPGTSAVRFLARAEGACIVFWISETDESTEAAMSELA